MSDKYNFSLVDSKWIVDETWHLLVRSMAEDGKKHFEDKGTINEIGSTTTGKVGEEKGIHMFKFVTVMVTGGQVMEANCLCLRKSLVYLKAPMCNSEFGGCIGKGKPIRETASNMFLVV